MPSMSVRAFAEMMNLPAYEQAKILHEQKYPSEVPQSFRIPYYQVSLNGIRAYYRSGNSPAVITLAMAGANRLKPPSKKRHNLRVLEQFYKGAQARRYLGPKATNRLTAISKGVDIRLQFDLVAQEGQYLRHILYNFRVAAIEDEIARQTLEVAHWVMEKNGLSVPISTLEFVDLTSGRVHSWRTRRKGTITLLHQNARIIQTLWPTV